jgi:hypothetical protein
MRQQLQVHPDHISQAISAISVEIEPAPYGLALRYRVEGRTADIVIPPLASPRRMDGLWQTTCLEAFFRTPGASGYLEFNFSPSTEWAAYAFDAHRSGRRPFDIIHAPIISHVDHGPALEIHVTLPIDPQPWLAALSAVIEEKDGTKSYWALAHPPGEPDFHHPDCFALELPAAPAA